MTATAASRRSSGATSWTIRPWRRSPRIVHEADLGDERYDVPEAPGLDLAIRALGANRSDDELLAITDPLFDAIYELYATRQA